MSQQDIEMTAEETAPPALPVKNVISSPDIKSNSEKKSCCTNTKQFFLYDSARQEIQAFYYNQFGRSTLFISFMFLSLAILQLANEQAGCPQNENGGYENCGNEVYGMQPSSMLALMAIIGGLATACFMPYAGAVVDYSNHRLGFGRAMASILVLTNFIQIFIFPSTWFAMTLLQSVFASASFMANSIVLWSYVEAPSEHDLHGITASGRIWETTGMLLFFIIVGIVQFTSGWDSVGIARFAQGYASLVGGVSMFLSYRRYQPVPAVKKLQEGKNLFVAGITELWQTLWDLGKTEPAAQRFLITSAFVEAANGSFVSLAITYLTSQIEMSGTMVVLFIVINLLTNPLGIIVHRMFSRRFGHKKSYVTVVAYMIVITALFVGVVAGPDQKNLTLIISVLYGIAFGWYYPCSNGFFVSLAPKERVSELWGFNIFSAVCLQWVPPLIFAALNESTGNLRLGMVGIIIFLVIGLSIAVTIPNRVIVEDEKGEDDVPEEADKAVGNV